MNFFNKKADKQNKKYQRTFIRISGDEYQEVQKLLNDGWEILDMSSFGYSTGGTGDFGIIKGYMGCYIYLQKEINN